MSAVWLFPGQGSQYVGMGGSYLKAYPSVVRRLEQASECLGVDLSQLIAKGPRNQLMQTDMAQVAIYTLSVAVSELLAARGMSPVAVAGHSLGQFSALVAAGALNFEAGLALVVDRGRFMHAQNQQIDGAMLAVTALDCQEIEAELLGIEQVWIANYNAPGQIILSGLRSALQAAQARLAAAGGKLVWLDVAGPYHTALLKDAARQFSASIQRVDLRQAAAPLLANSDAAVLTRAEDLLAELHRHMLAPVCWSHSMQRIAAMNVQFLVEVGPGKVLRGLALRNVPHIRCLGTDSLRDFEQACTVLQEAGSCAFS